MAHYIWVDNFSKTVARTIPTLAKGVYTSMLWTGGALFVNPDPFMDDSVRVDAVGEIIPAMPNSLLDGSRVVSAAVTQILAEGKEYLAKSLVHKYTINMIPPKIDTKQHPEMKSIIDNPLNTMANVYPDKLIEENIGSNRGLVSIFRKMYMDWGMDTDDCHRYKSFNLDENIYWRVLKVLFGCVAVFCTMLQLGQRHVYTTHTQIMYDGSGCGVKFRKFAGVGLAWWHSYKWCTKYIMKVFASDFIVPFIHYMFPTRTIKLDSMDHTNHVAYLTYIRLSYPRWKGELAAALARPMLNPRQRTLLTNMKDLCEYFIPVVCLNEPACGMNVYA